MAVKEKVTMSEAVGVSKNPAPAALDPLVGKAVKVCIACGKVLSVPYPVDDAVPTVEACHGEKYVREDYAPSVRLGPDGLAVAGEPMDHVRVRTAKKE